MKARTGSELAGANLDFAKGSPAPRAAPPCQKEQAISRAIARVLASLFVSARDICLLFERENQAGVRLAFTID